MKILIFAELYYPDVMGGGEYSTKQMTEGLVKKGHEVIVYCLGEKDSVEEINGVHIHRKYSKGLSEHFLGLTKNKRVEYSFSKLGKIRRKWRDILFNKRWYEMYKAVIEKEAPDAVHTASPMSYLGRYNLWKAAFDLDIPVSHVSRSPVLLQLNFLGGRLNRSYIRVNAKASSYLTALAAPSRFTLSAHNRVGIRGRRFNDVIYNALDFTPVPPAVDLIESKENLVLYAGEISRKKGILTLIEAMEGLLDTRLILIGKGELYNEIKGNGSAEVIDWMDRDSLYTYMKRAKAVVLPSIWNEPFGRILIEAVGNGTIGIGSDRGGIPEVLNFNNDHIFHSGDALDLRSRIERVLRMTALEYMEDVGKQIDAISKYSNDDYIDKWERFFLQQLS